jgi:FkbM family methyltransferase
MKRLVKYLLRRLGFEIVRNKRFGANPWQDINTIFQGLPLQTVFDVGANKGQTSMEFLHHFPAAAIHSFEPFPDAYDKLRQASAGCARIKPVPTALGEAVGQRVLYLNAESATNSLLPNASDADCFMPKGFADARGTAPVAMLTVDAYCEQESLMFIDLIKVDTQGYDLKVLQGAERMVAGGYVAAIYTEVLFAPMYEGQTYFHDIYGHLWARGFRLVSLYGVALNSQKFTSWCDALFLHPEILRSSLANRPGGTRMTAGLLSPLHAAAALWRAR